MGRSFGSPTSWAVSWIRVLETHRPSDQSRFPGPVLRAVGLPEETQPRLLGPEARGGGARPSLHTGASQTGIRVHGWRSSQLKGWGTQPTSVASL